jgi:hypothetical protein
LLAKEKKYSLSRQKSQSDFEAVDNRNDERLISAYRLVKTEILRYPTENELKSNKKSLETLTQILLNFTD